MIRTASYASNTATHNTLWVRRHWSALFHKRSFIFEDSKSTKAAHINPLLRRGSSLSMERIRFLVITREGRRESTALNTASISLRRRKTSTSSKLSWCATRLRSFLTRSSCFPSFLRPLSDGSACGKERHKLTLHSRAHRCGACGSRG